jgi:4-amino-4-deoxy-L-arabinose transferase-like glycosyltransferase
MVRSLALVSVFFYAAFVAAAYRLGHSLGGPRPALAAALYAALPPTFVNWYSLSNDGNYVEVLALGCWALWLTLRLCDAEPRARPALALAVGLLLGLALWSHILAIVYLAAALLAVVVALRAAALPVLGFVVLGFVLGDLPGLLWNASHDWASFRYLLPSGEWEALRPVEAAAEGRPGLLRRLGLTLTDHAPVLFGYDSGYPATLDRLSRAMASLGALTFAAALVVAGRRALHARRLEANALLLLFVAANLGVALFALPFIPGNPRYLLFLFGPACVLVGAALSDGRRVVLLCALTAFGTLGSLGQARAKLADAAAWRGFIADLRREGVRHCYTDYYLAARISFFAEEQPLCSSKLGPTTREYFLEHRESVERAPSADIVAVNATSAARMEKKLLELGVAYERRDFMKPVLLRLSRKVDPRELFPGRDFRPR